MKKILIFVLLIVSNICLGQEIPSVNNYSELSNNYRGELGTGNFVFDAPLFNLETVNPNFNFQGNLFYNSQAASTIFTSEGIMRRGWSVDFLPTIARNIDKNNTLWDEKYYYANTNNTDNFPPGYTRPTREYNDLFEFNIYGLSGSFRLEYNTSNITVLLIDCNSYVEIIPDYILLPNGNGKNIHLLSFTIKDQNGYSYIFSEAEESGLFQSLNFSYTQLLEGLGNSGGTFYDFLSYKKGFLISKIYDKYNNLLVDYTYKTYPHTLQNGGKLFAYNQKVIDQILIPNKGSLIFTTTKSKINTIELNDSAQNLFQKINLTTGEVSFYNAQDQLMQQYLLNYYSDGDKTKINNYGNFLIASNTSLGDQLIYSDQVQRISAGLLFKIYTPHKGSIEIEYEPTTYSISTSNNSMYDNNIYNSDYIEIPVSYNSTTKKYTFNKQTDPNIKGYYLKFHSEYYENPFYYPGSGLSPGFYPQISTPIQHFKFEDIGEHGIEINNYSTTTLVQLTPQSGYESYISLVKVYKKVNVQGTQRKNFLYGPSARVKKIKQLNHNNEVINETNYSYQIPDNPTFSSGRISSAVWFLDNHSSVASLKPYPVFHSYLTVEQTGKGKTVYQLNTDQFINNRFGIPQVVFHPVTMRKYDETGQLIEEIDNTFEYFKISTDPSARNRFKKISSSIKTHEGTQFKLINTEKSFDNILFEVTSNTVTDSGTSDTFEEQYTYQKLGNAFYQTGVEKTKNNTELNRSTYAYQQQGSTQAYNLKTVSVAKESRPLEVEREITDYDDYGNITEYKTKDGMVVSQIWGYNDSKMVAELKNVTYASINQPTITAIKFNSNAATYDEITLVNLLNGLRDTHSNGFVTTYTYKPLVGITSVTDANGRKESYVYDSFNRLWRVFNHEGLIVKEYEYNIKN